MPTPLVLYSTYSWLAHAISQNYYGGSHYVWCTPHFEPGLVPPTSSPKRIYETLFQEVSAGDRHSAKIAQKRLGIQRGADVQYRNGIITSSARDEILEIVNCAETRDFRPLLFVIPYPPIAAHLKQVPIKERAHPLSEEFILERLPRDGFDILEIR